MPRTVGPGARVGIMSALSEAGRVDRGEAMVLRIFGIGVAAALLTLGPAAAWQDLEILEQAPDLPGAPYFSWKTGLQLIQGSPNIAPLAPIQVGATRQLLLDKYI